MRHVCRGAVALQVDLTTAGTDMHSGMKGGSVQNAAHALVQLLATLRDPETGRVSHRCVVGLLLNTLMMCTLQNERHLTTPPH
jgi:hypothetical protein